MSTATASPESPRHYDTHNSCFTVRTDYGAFYLCGECVTARHMDPDGEYSPRRHELHDTTGCQCEHVTHFPD